MPFSAADLRHHRSARLPQAGRVPSLDAIGYATLSVHSHGIALVVLLLAGIHVHGNGVSVFEATANSILRLVRDNYHRGVGHLFLSPIWQHLEFGHALRLDLGLLCDFVWYRHLLHCNFSEITHKTE